MKNKVLIIGLVVVLVIGIIWDCVREEKKKNNKITEGTPISQEVIPNPDRIVFKEDSKYYEISKYSENYDELVNLCRNNASPINEYTIEEDRIDSLKQETNFIEFDYDTISKNSIFFLSGDIGIVKMNDTDGKVISNSLKNTDKILEKFKETVKNKGSYNFENSIITSGNNYEFLPSTLDFQEIKYDKVYKKEFKDAEDFRKIVKLYNLDFANINIDELLEEKKVILFLTKYSIADYKVNIGNIKISFVGNDYEVPVSRGVCSNAYGS